MSRWTRTVVAALLLGGAPWGCHLIGGVDDLEFAGDGCVSGNYKDLEPILASKLAAKFDEPIQHLLKGDCLVRAIHEAEHGSIASVE